MSWRILNKDGTFNIAKDRYKRFPWEDLYHSLLRVTWKRFFSIVAAIYVAVNLLFGAIYFSLGRNALEGINPQNETERFFDSLFFSVQTLATIGYGKISPHGIPANFVVMLEALTGILGIAVITGILFARFSRPTARVLFSHNALLAPHNGEPCLIFRMANKRYNQIVDADVSVVVVINQITKEGQSFRNPFELKLQRSHSAFFNLSWTVIHTIDAQSPLHGLSKKDLEKLEAEVIVTITGIDDTFSSTVHAKTSYSPEELITGHRFADILRKMPDGRIFVDLHRFHDLVPLQ